MLRRSWHRLINVLASGRAEDELARETNAHLALLEEDFQRRGFTAAAARVEARKAFGGIEQMKDRHRDARSFVWLDDARRDVQYAARSLRRTPGFAAVAVLTLALGIGANVTIFTLLDAVVLKPLPVPAASELVMFYETGPEGPPDPTGGFGRYLRLRYPRVHRLPTGLGSFGSVAPLPPPPLFSARPPPR